MLGEAGDIVSLGLIMAIIRLLALDDILTPAGTLIVTRASDIHRRQMLAVTREAACRSRLRRQHRAGMTKR